MNDAVGLVLFNAFAKFVSHDNTAGKVTLGILEFVVTFVVNFAGSFVLGIFSGMLAAALLKYVDMRQHSLLELSLYIMIMYVPFLLAEILQLSGIVTILFSGVAARRYVVPNLSEGTDDHADTFFRLAAHIAETSIFLELGLSVAGLSGRGLFHWTFISWSLLACLVGRALNVYPICFAYNLSLRKPALGEDEGIRYQADTDQESHVEMVETARENETENGSLDVNSPTKRKERLADLTVNTNPGDSSRSKDSIKYGKHVVVLRSTRCCCLCLRQDFSRYVWAQTRIHGNHHGDCTHYSLSVWWNDRTGTQAAQD